MNLFKKLSGSKEDKPKESNFTIEFYPLSGIYFAKYERYYMKTDYSTGIVELQKPDWYFYADRCRSENEARKLIAKYKEQQYKVNVQVIKVD